MRPPTCRSVTLVALLCLVAVAAAACSGGKKTPKVSPGTQSVGLPPVPTDIATEVYKVDALYSTRCADVPSGMNNCLDLLRREALRELSGVIEQEIAGEQIDSGTQTSRGDAAGTIEEDLIYARNFIRQWEAPLTLRKIESPVFSLPDGQTYAMRVIALREETDYLLFTEMAEKAKAEDRQEVAARIELRLEQRYGNKPPDRSKISSLERRVSDHYNDLWEMTQKNPKAQ